MSKKNGADPRANDPNYTTVFVKSITLKNGRRLLASELGVKAIPIKVKVKKS